MSRVRTFAHVLVFIAAVLIAVAFIVAVGWFGHNWYAWTTAGLFFFVLSFLPWRSAP